MNYTWIQNNDNKLIIFFNGWGCDVHQFAHLKNNQYDVLLINDYTQLVFDDEQLNRIKQYDEINIVAWSYGVYIAQYICKKHELSINKAIAINGTTSPIDEQFGIPESIVQGTLDNLTERNLTKFQRRMVGGSVGWTKFEQIKPKRAFEEQKQELKALIQYFKQETLVGNFYSKVIIGTQDLIFVPDNQRKFWQDKASIKEIEAAHFCFFDIYNWDDLLA